MSHLNKMSKKSCLTPFMRKETFVQYVILSSDRNELLPERLYRTKEHSMSRSGPKYWEITIFDSANPKHRRVFSSIWYSLVVVLLCLAISRVVMHPPLDYFALFEYTACFGILLFVSMLMSTGLWSKPIFR